MTPDPTQEQRHFSRIPFHAPVRLSGASGATTTALLDLSLHGALVAQPAIWPHVAPGTPLDLSIQLGTADEERILMQTQVVHAEGGRLGLLCLHIDLDSITQLRRLIALNLGDAALLERELSALG